MNIIKKLTPFFVGFCVATTIAQAIVLGVLWQKRALTADKRFRILAALYQIDLDAMEHESKQKTAESTSNTEMAKQRATDTEELTSRDKSFRQSLGGYKSLNDQLREVRRQNELLKINFDNRLAKLEQEAINASLSDVQQTLEAIKTKQAKIQLLRMLDDDAMDDVIKLVTAMSVDKRKKIFNEFKSASDAERLHDILRQMRNVAERPSGDPDNREL